jgi:penicillin-binding protein 1A
MDYEPLPEAPAGPPPLAEQTPRGPLRVRRPGKLRRDPARPRRTVRGHLWRWAWVYALGLGACSGLLVAAVIHMPEVDAIDDFRPGLVTELFDRHGGSYANYAFERRVLLRQGQVPKLLQDAIVAVEDQHFTEHSGVDLAGILRAAVENVRAGRIQQGASTLTMQVAENVFHTRGRSWRRKIEEALLAVEIEKRYSKQQIITLYCNVIYTGNGNYGMAAAATDYFNKPVGQLTLAEAATLAGIPQRPNEYNPYHNPAGVTKRRNHVLRRMLAANKIDEPTYRAAVAEPLLLAQRRRTPQESGGTYFAEEVRRYLEQRYGSQRLYGAGLRVGTTLDPKMQAAAEEAVRKHLLAMDHRRGWRGPLVHLDREDPEAQTLPSWRRGERVVPGRWYEGVVVAAGPDSAEVRIGEERFTLERHGIAWTRKAKVSDALKRGDVAWFRLEAPTPADGKAPARAVAAKEPATPRLMLEQEPRIEGVMLVLDSASGAVRAMVGGWDFERSKFNRATQAQRQVGSAFKPFVYGAAIEQGYTAADTLFDAPTAFIGADAKLSYFPQNYYHKYAGVITLRRALEQSVNVPAVKLLDLIGVRRVIDFARRTGIASPLPPYPSLALGSADLVPIELAAAYATFANSGLYMHPYFVEQVATADGEVLEHHTPQARKAMDAPAAYVLTHMLEGVIDHGTAFSLSPLEVDIAGKTGTTDDYSDAWFVGYTPKLTMLTWVGYDVKKSLGNGMTGAAAALPPWKEVAERGLAEGWIAKGEKFVAPPGVTMLAVERYTGLLPPPGGGSYLRLQQEAFVAGTEPNRPWEGSLASVSGLPWYQQRAFYLPKEGERMP